MPHFRIPAGGSKYAPAHGWVHSNPGWGSKYDGGGVALAHPVCGAELLEIATTRAGQDRPAVRKLEERMKHFHKGQDVTPQEINEAVARGLGWIDSDFPVKSGWYKLEVQPGSWTYSDEFPDYCHSIAAAWEIPTSMKDGRFEIKRFGDEWICIIDDQIETDRNPAMAICLAFLKVP